MTTTRACRRWRGWRCSICCSAPTTALGSISSRCSTSSRSSALRRPWEEGGARTRPGARPVSGGYVGFTGKLTAAHAPQIANLLAASHKQPQVRMDLGSLTGADDAGAKLLADALAQLRKRQYPLVLQHPEKLRRALDESVKQGKGAGEGYWILLLELMQWQNDHKTFEDRAIEFAIAFEVSPPSWEPPPVAISADGPASEASAGAPQENAETLVWSGTMTGSSDPQLSKLALFREGRHADSHRHDRGRSRRFRLRRRAAQLDQPRRGAAQVRADHRRVADHPRAAAPDRYLAAALHQESAVSRDGGTLSRATRS